MQSRKLAELWALMEPGGRQSWHWGRWDRHNHSGVAPHDPGTGRASSGGGLGALQEGRQS